MELPAGEYAVIDSDGETWSYSAGTHGQGFTWVYATLTLMMRTAQETQGQIPGGYTIVGIAAVVAAYAFALGRRFAIKKVGREGKELPVPSSP